MTSARNKLKKFFTDNAGRTITTKELSEVAGIASYARRIRELRQDGWPILTNNDANDLKPGEYRLEGKPPADTYRFTRGNFPKTACRNTGKERVHMPDVRRRGGGYRS